MNELKGVKEIFDKIASVSSKKSKETIIKQNSDNELFLECLKFLYDSNITTGLSKKKINKDVKVYQNTCDDIRDMFDYVRMNNTGTDRDIGVVQGYINSLDDMDNKSVLGFGAEYPTSCIEDKMIKGYPDTLLAYTFVSL